MKDDRAFAMRLARDGARNPVALEQLADDRAAKAVTHRSGKSPVRTRAERPLGHTEAAAGASPPVHRYAQGRRPEPMLRPPQLNSRSRSEITLRLRAVQRPKRPIHGAYHFRGTAVVLAECCGDYRVCFFV
jgi:hypothetical protein